MKLQACTKCGAQFDVSSFTPGQQFTCEPCGTVLTAGGEAKPAGAASSPKRAPKSSSGAPKRRTPGSGGSAGGASGVGRAPAQGRAPGSSRKPAAPKGGARGRSRAGGQKAVRGGPAAIGKGPQYQPVQRAGQDGGKKAAAPSRPKPSRAGGARRSARRGEGEEGGRPVRSSGPNKGLLVGVGVVIVALVVGLVVMGGGEKKNEAGGGGKQTASGGDKKKAAPPAPTETAREVMAEYVTERPTLLREYRRFISRLKAIDGEAAENGLRTVYEDFIKGAGKNDKDARKFLGYMEFPHEIPEDIAFREYPYLRAVTAAYQRQWFAPDEKDEYETAMKAWRKTEEHREKLINDHRFRAADGIRANIAKDKYFKDYNYAARWSDPHLICYASKERISEFEILQIEDKAERKAKRAEILARQERFEAVLDEKQAIFSQLYKEFMDRYQESLSLKPLMDEFGGRPDYPGNVRTYRDGAPVVVWIFDTKAAFDEYHTKVKKEMVPHNVAGYFSPKTTYVYLYDEGDNSRNRVFEINKNVHEGVHQLQYWFTRQRNRWRQPLPGQTFFKEGIAEFLGSVQLQPDWKMKFLGVNVPRLQGMQGLAGVLKERGGKYELFPVEKLVGFTSYFEAKSWGNQTWGLDHDTVMGMFYQQSWAFVYFLNTYKNGKYKKKFEEFFNLVLHRETGGETGDKAFRTAFRIRDDDDWEDLNDEFHEFIREELMNMDTGKFTYTPPERGKKK